MRSIFLHYLQMASQGGHFPLPHAATADTFRVLPPEAMVYQSLINNFQFISRLDNG